VRYSIAPHTLNSALVGSENQLHAPAAILPEGLPIGDWMSPRAGMDAV
jgi:hypothetical protein